jgi:hypothetical protein
MHVRPFDPSKPPAKVAAGKPVAPPMLVKHLKYPVGSTGPNGGIVCRVGERGNDYIIWETLPESFPDRESIPSGWRWLDFLDDFETVRNWQQSGKVNFGDGWFRIDSRNFFNMKTGICVFDSANDGKVINPETGEAIDTAAVRFLKGNESIVNAFEQ